MEEEYIERPEKPSNLLTEQQYQLDNLLEEYQDIIANKSDPLGHTNQVQHNIIIDNTPPIKQRPYHISPTEHEFVEKEILRMIEQGII